MTWHPNTSFVKYPSSWKVPTFEEQKHIVTVVVTKWGFGLVQWSVCVYVWVGKHHLKTGSAFNITIWTPSGAIFAFYTHTLVEYNKDLSIVCAAALYLPPPFYHPCFSLNRHHHPHIIETAKAWCILFVSTHSVSYTVCCVLSYYPFVESRKWKMYVCY